MRIEINPRSLLNLENICEVLYKLHPSVLDELVQMERSLGSVLGSIDLNNLTMGEREFLSNILEKKDYSIESDSLEEEERSKEFDSLEEEERNEEFHNLRKYIQLDTDEYIPIKISIEVEDPVIGKKVCELVRALETTRAPEQFYLNKEEMDVVAYFAEGYGLTMNEEQRKKFEDFFGDKDVEGLKELLRKEKLYP